MKNILASRSERFARIGVAVQGVAILRTLREAAIPSASRIRPPRGDRGNDTGC